MEQGVWEDVNVPKEVSAVSGLAVYRDIDLLIWSDELQKVEVDLLFGSMY